MKKSVLLILCLTMFLIGCISVHASNDWVCNINVNMNKITVTGKLPINKIKEVTIQVLNPGKTIADLFKPNPDSFMSTINYQNQTTSNKDGEFVFDYIMNGTVDTYTMYLTTSGYSYTKTFNFYGSEYVNDIIDEINDAKDAKDTQALKKLITDHYVDINLSSAAYETFINDSSSNIDEFFDFLILNDKVKTITDLSTQLGEVVAILKINKCTDASEVEIQLEQYKKELGIDKLTAYQVYNTILTGDDSFVKTSICTKLLENKTTKKYIKAIDITNDFQTQTILQSVNKVTSWSVLKSVLELTANVTGINFTACNSLTYPEKAFLNFLNSGITSVSSIKVEFDKVVSSLRNTTITPSPGSNNGGTRGKSDSKGVFIPEYTSSQSQSADVFNDLTNFEWAKQSIEKLYNMNIVNGKGNGIYSPGDYVTREEFVKMIVLVVSTDNNSNTSINFNDISNDAWYSKYITSAYNMSLINGKGDGNFGIGDNITREDMAVMVYRAILYKNSNLLSDNVCDFNDANEISDYALKSIAFLQDNGIINGFDNKIFAPKQYTNRAQVAVVICRVIELLNM